MTTSGVCLARIRERLIEEIQGIGLAGFNGDFDGALGGVEELAGALASTLALGKSVAYRELLISSAVRRAESKRTNQPLGFPWLRLRSANGTQGLAVPTITVMAVSQRLRTRASGPLAGGTPALPTGSIN